VLPRIAWGATRQHLLRPSLHPWLVARTLVSKGVACCSLLLPTPVTLELREGEVDFDGLERRTRSDGEVVGSSESPINVLSPHTHVRNVE
jgi:hypothetical protein